jgi:cholesterol transport system auxiliary component
MVSRMLLSCLGGALLLSGGCVGIERSYPDKRYFVITLTQKVAPANPPSTNTSGVLLVSNLRVSPRYDGKSFVYRRSEANFESDYYNQFLISPGAILTEEVRKALAAAEIFQAVIDRGSQLDPTHRLEGAINALYGDFRGGAPPKAVLEIEFFLTRASAASTDILLQRQYRASIPVDSGSAEALVRAWSQGLDEILLALIADLRKAIERL